MIGDKRRFEMEIPTFKNKCKVDVILVAQRGEVALATGKPVRPSVRPSVCLFVSHVQTRFKILK